MPEAIEQEHWVNARLDAELLADLDKLVVIHDRDRSKEIRAAIRHWRDIHRDELRTR